MDEKNPILVWLDLEMTGLDEARCAILEIGLVVTGHDLEPRGELARALWQPEEVLARMEPHVRDMHTRNGLLDRVRSSSTSLVEAEAEALRLVLRHAVFGEAILAGNSVHTDRRFLARYMPALERAFHYRHVDVSTLKVLTRAWYAGEQAFEKEEQEHTVLADIRQSLVELRHYRDRFFRAR